MAKGENPRVLPYGKLKEHVLEIRRLKASGYRVAEIARKFNCSDSAINGIVLGYNYFNIR